MPRYVGKHDLEARLLSRAVHWALDRVPCEPYLKLRSEPVRPLVELGVCYRPPAKNERRLRPHFLGLLLEELVDAEIARTRILLCLLRRRQRTVS
jgi:hypothetical protein